MPSSIRSLRRRQIPAPCATAPSGRGPNRKRAEPPSPIIALPSASSSGPPEVHEAPQQNSVQDDVEGKENDQRPPPLQAREKHRQRNEDRKRRGFKSGERSERPTHRRQYPEHVSPHQHI